MNVSPDEQRYAAITLIVSTAMLALTSNALAQSAEAVSSIEASALNGSSFARQQSTSIEQCWASWKKEQHLHEGSNDRPDGSSIYVGFDSSEVRGSFGTSSWIAARGAAFTRAELSARKALAEKIGVDLRSQRETLLYKAGGDQSPPLPGQATPPSNAERLTTLSGLALDNAIRQFDPKWNGGSLSDAEKRQQAITLMNQASEEDEAQARVDAEGAFTAVQCEGPLSAENGSAYGVLVGLIQSPKLARVAQSITDPRIKAPPFPKKLPIDDQFAQRAAEQGDWMAFTQGARVWSDEKGDPVVIGFGVTSASSMSSADQAQARLRALVAVQRFVGEQIVARERGNGLVADTETANGQRQDLDSSVFQQRIAARAKDLHLSGVQQVGTWRGMHPVGKVPMQVVAMAWSPTFTAEGRKIENTMRPVSPTAVPVETTAPPSGPVAAPVNRGADADTSGF